MLVEAWGFDEHNFYWYWEGVVFFGFSVFAPRREVHMARIWAELLRLFEPRSSPPPRAADCNSSELVALTAGGEPLKRDEWAEFLRLAESREPDACPR